MSGAEQLAAFETIKGQTVAYRKRDASPSDETTFLFRPRTATIENESVLTWIVADQLAARVKTKYDKSADDTTEELTETDEIRSSRFVAIPRLGVLAIDDRAGDRHLGARSAAGRLRAIMASTSEVDVAITFAGTPQDVDRALATWSLDHFAFTVRPSNPHPPKLGEKLDELLKLDQVGKFRGVATPSNKEKMKVSEHGLIMEAKSLSDAGYGQYGASGTTPAGLSATISSPKFDMVKENNLKRQSESRLFKIHIDQAESLEQEDQHVVKALLEMYSE